MSRHPSSIEGGAARSCLYFIERGRSLNKADICQLAALQVVNCDHPQFIDLIGVEHLLFYQQKKSVSFLFHYCHDIGLLIF